MKKIKSWMKDYDIDDIDYDIDYHIDAMGVRRAGTNTSSTRRPRTRRPPGWRRGNSNGIGTIFRDVIV